MLYYGGWHAGGKEADLQIRFAPGLALDPDGIGSYTAFGLLNKKNMKWPSGITFQLLAIRPKCAARCYDMPSIAWPYTHVLGPS